MEEVVFVLHLSGETERREEESKIRRQYCIAHSGIRFWSVNYNKWSGINSLTLEKQIKLSSCLW